MKNIKSTDKEEVTDYDKLNMTKKYIDTLTWDDWVGEHIEYDENQVIQKLKNGSNE